MSNTLNKTDAAVPYYQDDLVTLYHGNCLDVLPVLTGDAIITDPPYGTTQNKWDSVVPFEDLWPLYDASCSGPVVQFSQGLFTAATMLSNPKNFKYKLTWVKSKATNFLNAKKQPLRKHEDICVFYKKQPTYNPQMTQGEAYDKGVRKDALTGSYGDFSPVRVKSSGDRYPVDVLYHATAESEGKTTHPTQKPVGLLQTLIRTYTNVGDTVIDPFAGTGSTLIAARREGRKVIGVELDQDYCDSIVQRLKQEAPIE